MNDKNEVIWPLSVRFIHWIVALVVLLDAFWLEEGDAPHEYLGYLAAVLVIVRFGIGILGHGAVKFSAMPIKANDFKIFLRNHFKGQAHFEAHNPLASVVYLLMWLLIIGLAVTGWMMGLDAFWGDQTLEEIHSQFSNALVGLAIVHLIGLMIDSFIYKRRTWMGMIDGKKK